MFCFDLFFYANAKTFNAIWIYKYSSFGLPTDLMYLLVLLYSNLISLSSRFTFEILLISSPF
ncbi:MAG: hypothetical protein SOX81_07975 [Campylobacter sp.]|nr:hypothetical protein [Campylobacter sp.]